jgi:hypothetical protein
MRLTCRCGIASNGASTSAAAPTFTWCSTVSGCRRGRSSNRTLDDPRSSSWSYSTFNFSPRGPRSLDELKPLLTDLFQTVAWHRFRYVADGLRSAARRPSAALPPPSSRPWHPPAATRASRAAAPVVETLEASTGRRSATARGRHAHRRAGSVRVRTLRNRAPGRDRWADEQHGNAAAPGATLECCRGEAARAQARAGGRR